mmetsp:Transcript_5883/g.8907  ORF Transcript_5883/g.8907 Transcript_5883/m.8907 type:complete len:192 (+) Transcript_5883:237-812(+)
MGNPQKKKKAPLPTKIAILGGGGVGKSSLILKFVQNEFRKIADCEPGITHRKRVEIDDKVYFLEIIECVGEQYLLEQQIRDSDFFFVVYSLTRQGTFGGWVPDLLDFIDRVKDGFNCYIMLVANKTDQEDLRQIEKSLVQQYADEKGILYKEVSAKTGEGVDEMFFEMIRYSNNNPYHAQQHNVNIKRAVN